jgi:hypothetical protein
MSNFTTIKVDHLFVISETDFRKQLGMQAVSDPTFADALFKRFQNFSSQKGILDVRGFLLALGTIFKGTVDERIKCKFGESS